MSGYFDAVGVKSRNGGDGIRVGNTNNIRKKNDVSPNPLALADNNYSNSAATTLLQQLAASMMHNNNSKSGTQNVLQNELPEVAHLSQMLAQLTTGKNNVPVVYSDTTTQNNNCSIGTNYNTDKEVRPFQKFFEPEIGSNRSSYRYGSTTTTQQQQHNIHRQTNNNNINKNMSSISSITQRQQNWYTEERAILRELIVLTMRHTNGSILRFVPSEEVQLQLWNTHGHLIGERYGPPNNIVAEGTVKIHPRVIVVPEWTRHKDDHDEDDDDSNYPVGTKEDIEFKSNLPTSLLGSGAHDAISLCAECGFLYSRVANYISMVLEEDIHGVQCATARALASRLDGEVALYHDTLSVLEGELPPLELTDLISLQMQQQNKEQQSSNSSSSTTTRYLTLRSLTTRLIPIRDHLRTLAILSSGIGSCNLRGGKLLSHVLRHSLDGTKTLRHSKLVRSIANDVAVPWYTLLNDWMTQGILNDVHSEFFVREVKPSHSQQMNMNISSSGYYTWHQRYGLVEGQIPLCSCGGLMDIITLDLAKEVLLVGKGINFIRYCLLDKDWEVVKVEEENDSDDEENGSSDVVGSTGYNFTTLMDITTDNDDELKCVSTLHEAVMKSSARIHSHILESLETKHHMMQHLLALKNFLFLGQGDFVSSFVECFNQEFHGRTSIAGIYSHMLSSLLEGSLRTTTARFLPNFVLGNLRARLMVDKNDSSSYYMGPPPNKAKDEEMVPWKEDNIESIQDPWDYIYLDYKINSPLDAIVHESAMETYHQVFLFLFRLKRVEWMLNNSWRQSTALNHAILIETKAGGADAPAISEAAEHSSFLLRRISSTRQTMLHFISNLQNYLMFEVLEGGWEGLVQSLSKAKSLDDVIRAHDSYLNDIVDKTLLSNDVNSVNGTSIESLLRKLLTIALKFGKFQDHIFSNSLAGLDKAAKIRRRVEERADKGDWGRTTLDKEEGRVFLYLADAELFEFVEKTANDFDQALSDLLRTMSKQIDEVDCTTSLDDDQEDRELVMKNQTDALPFLLFRLDFSGYYGRKAREMRKKKQSLAPNL